MPPTAIIYRTGFGSGAIGFAISTTLFVVYFHFVWAILILTLPTQPNAVRVRVWRALKTLGCAALRDGAYLLPSANASLFEPLAAEVREHGGTAMVLTLTPQDQAQCDELIAPFDRSEGYAQWHATPTTLQAELATRDSRLSARPKPGAVCAQ